MSTKILKTCSNDIATTDEISYKEREGLVIALNDPNQLTPDGKGGVGRK